MDREFDVIVWGATGFTGALVAEHLFARHGINQELRWALGGRNQAKLEAVRDRLGEGAKELPLVLGEGLEIDSMRGLAKKTSVVCSTVGPYAKYGSPLVQACAETGTDYCDLTGEIHWMQRMIETHEETARESGSRLVPTCGFDCIPADLGTWFVQEEMQRRHGIAASMIKMRVQGFSGAASGGTVASMLNMLEEARKDPSVMRAMREPYALNAASERSGPDGREVMTPFYDNDFGEWIGPFMMAGVDTKVVRRSNALLDYAYGRDFRYNEGMLTGAGPRGALKASAMAAGIVGGTAAMTLGPIRNSVGKRMPAPGEGPSQHQRESGFFDIRFHAAHPTDATRSLKARVTGDRDPGYGATSKMLGEAAACLALDDRPVGGGFWTPASAGGEALLRRLREHAGMTFAILDTP